MVSKIPYTGAMGNTPEHTVDIHRIAGAVKHNAVLQQKIATKQLLATQKLENGTGISHMELVLLERNESDQTRGATMEKIFANILGGKQISSTLGCGDIKDKDGKTYELKASFENKADTVNMRQIRLWQPIDHYIIVSIDTDNDNSHVFTLSHEEMVNEVSLLGTATHGTKEANKSNVNIEYSITLRKKDSHKSFSRWSQDFKDSFLENQLFSHDSRYFM